MCSMANSIYNSCQPPDWPEQEEKASMLDWSRGWDVCLRGEPGWQRWQKKSKKTDTNLVDKGDTNNTKKHRHKTVWQRWQKNQKKQTRNFLTKVTQKHRHETVWQRWQKQQKNTDTHLFDKGDTRGAASCRHMQPLDLSQLHNPRPNTTRSSLNQDSLAWLQLGFLQRLCAPAYTLCAVFSTALCFRQPLQLLKCLARGCFYVGCAVSAACTLCAVFGTALCFRQPMFLLG